MGLAQVCESFSKTSLSDSNSKAPLKTVKGSVKQVLLTTVFVVDTLTGDR